MAKDRFGFGTRSGFETEMMERYGTPEQDFRDIDVGGLSKSKVYQQAVKELGYGEGDYGYSMLALTIAAENGLIDKKMKPKQVQKILEKKRMDPYGFKVDQEMLDNIFEN